MSDTIQMKVHLRWYPTVNDLEILTRWGKFFAVAVKVPAVQPKDQPFVILDGPPIECTMIVLRWQQKVGMPWIDRVTQAPRESKITMVQLSGARSSRTQAKA